MLDTSKAQLNRGIQACQLQYIRHVAELGECFEDDGPSLSKEPEKGMVEPKRKYIFTKVRIGFNPIADSIPCSNTSLHTLPSARYCHMSAPKV